MSWRTEAGGERGSRLGLEYQQRASSPSSTPPGAGSSAPPPQVEQPYAGDAVPARDARGARKRGAPAMAHRAEDAGHARAWHEILDEVERRIEVAEAVLDGRLPLEATAVLLDSPPDAPPAAHGAVLSRQVTARATALLERNRQLVARAEGRLAVLAARLIGNRGRRAGAELPDPPPALLDRRA
jgi:hypothetical protein